MNRRLFKGIKIYTRHYLAYSSFEQIASILWLPSYRHPEIAQSIQQELITIVFTSIKKYERLYGRIGLELMSLPRMVEVLRRIDPLLTLSPKISTVDFFQGRKPSRIQQILNQPLTGEEGKIVKRLLDGVKEKLEKVEMDLREGA